jgi:hypothetical protein
MKTCLSFITLTGILCTVVITLAFGNTSALLGGKNYLPSSSMRDLSLHGKYSFNYIHKGPLRGYVKMHPFKFEVDKSNGNEGRDKNDPVLN